MTWVLGVFGGTTTFERNKYLKDGSACLLKDGKIFCAVAEERLSRVRHDGNYSRAVKYCLDTAGIGLEDIDLIVFSNCCDLPLEPHYCNGLGINPKKVFNISSHHLSHAYLAYKMSGFNSGIVIVMDNEGNIIGNKENHEYYWNNKLERNSYYRFDRGLSLLYSDCLEANEIGVGDTYHYFTHFLGWHSYTLAGRVMGLSGYGDSSTLNKVEVFSIDDSGKIKSNISNNRKNKESELQRLGWKFGVDLDCPRRNGEEINTRHQDIAALIQQSLEDILKKKVAHLTKDTAIENICFSGGVAYNCLANRAISDLPKVGSLFAPYCPGDEGQSIGNAVWGFCEILGGEIDSSITIPYLGIQYSQKSILEAVTSFKDFLYWEKRTDFSQIAAEEIARGKFIGWFQGGSEFGSRALGNRSILADPRKENLSEVLNNIKGRETFRPFSPSILAEYLEEYYDFKTDSPYMNMVGLATDLAKKKVPGVIHVDNSSRLQTVSKSDNEMFHTLITEFHKITQIPMVANTSFNYNGEPIVESPLDAIHSFLSMNLDLLVIDQYVIWKKGK